MSHSPLPPPTIPSTLQVVSPTPPDADATDLAPKDTKCRSRASSTEERTEDKPKKRKKRTKTKGDEIDDIFG